jgi:hypothetical protein
MVWVTSVAGVGEVLQRRFAQRVGKTRIVDGAGEYEGTDHRGHGDGRVLVRAPLPPVGRLTGDEVEQHR